ncbi:MAG TPA: hypothetical protein VIH86_13845 [Puia sp.]
MLKPSKETKTVKQELTEAQEKLFTLADTIEQQIENLFKELAQLKKSIDKIKN